MTKSKFLGRGEASRFPFDSSAFRAVYFWCCCSLFQQPSARPVAAWWPSSDRAEEKRFCSYLNPARDVASPEPTASPARAWLQRVPRKGQLCSPACQQEGTTWGGSVGRAPCCLSVYGCRWGTCCVPSLGWEGGQEEQGSDCMCLANASGDVTVLGSPGGAYGSWHS